MSRVPTLVKSEIQSKPASKWKLLKSWRSQICRSKLINNVLLQRSGRSRWKTVATALMSYRSATLSHRGIFWATMLQVIISIWQHWYLPIMIPFSGSYHSTYGSWIGYSYRFSWSVYACGTEYGSGRGFHPAEPLNVDRIIVAIQAPVRRKQVTWRSHRKDVFKHYLGEEPCQYTKWLGIFSQGDSYIEQNRSQFHRAGLQEL